MKHKYFIRNNRKEGKHRGAVTGRSVDITLGACGSSLLIFHDIRRKPDHQLRMAVGKYSGKV